MESQITLVSRARTDGDALGELFNHFYEPIYKFCLYRLFVPAKAEDITSAVFLKMARDICNFRGTTLKQFAAWLYGIALNETRSYLRKSRRRRVLLESAAMAGQLGRGGNGSDESVEKTILAGPVRGHSQPK